MKKINTYINEKLKISKTTYSLFPKTYEELDKMITNEINKNGNECSLNHIDVSKITKMDALFFESEFNGDISQWDVSNVKSMVNMFDGSSYTGIHNGIADWDVSNVENMSFMFASSEFDANIDNWDVRNVWNMEHMFRWCAFNQDISSWDVSNVETMESMFEHSDFRKDISNWQINSKCITSNMFFDCKIQQNRKPKGVK